MKRMLIISFDAVGDSQFSQLARRPHFSALLARARVNRRVDSVFLTNTYPVHASVATGLPPHRHGLTGNTLPFPARHPQWLYQEKFITAETLWQAAAKKRLRTAAVMWPVTAGSKTIRYNIPEIMALPGQNQVRLNMKYGSALLQARLYKRHRHLLSGISQPARDAFATACMADILRRKKPHLALMHLTAYDSLCHEHGLDSPELEAAFDSLDENLGLLLDAAAEDTAVIVFSDHAQLPAAVPVLPNEILREMGLLRADGEGTYIENSGERCFFECGGGSAFFHPGRLPPRLVEEVHARTADLAGFNRFLSGGEMHTCGRKHLPFGFCAKPGYACEAYPSAEKANHGYPIDYADYKVFYLRAGPGTEPLTTEGGTLLDLAPLVSEYLDLQMSFT